MSIDFRKLSLFVCAFLLTACTGSLPFFGDDTPEEDMSGVPSGNILVWHSWQGNDYTVLRDLFNDYTELHPGVRIVDEYYSVEDIEALFLTEVHDGLGPDLLLAPSYLVREFIHDNAIRELSSYDLNLDNYLSTAVTMVQDEDKVYGLPLSLNTDVLYYNKPLLESYSREVEGVADDAEGASSDAGAATDQAALANLVATIQSQQGAITDTQTVELLNELLRSTQQAAAQSVSLSPPTDIDELLEQASQGVTVAIPTSFSDVVWGVGAFGGQIFDEEGRVILNQGSFANWLSWLQQAQEIPTVFFAANRHEVQSLFESGQIVYYVGETHELSLLQSALGADNLGVVRLPGHTDRPATPFLTAEVLVFNRAATQRNTDIAFNLAKFLTNREQQRALAYSIGKLPAHNRVNIDPRLSPIAAEFIAQSKTAVPVALNELVGLPKIEAIIGVGNNLISQVLSGELNAGDAANQVTVMVNEQFGLDTLTSAEIAGTCDLTGEIVVWHTWIDAFEETLEAINQEFKTRCPDATVTLVHADAGDTFEERYIKSIERQSTTNGEQTDNPDPLLDTPPTMFLANGSHLRSLAPAGQVQDFSELIDADFMQRFIPTVDAAVRYNDNIYGIPVALRVETLFYNKDMVADPPSVLNDLLSAASPESRVGIPIDFVNSYWGISAFGESGVTPQVFDENGQLMLAQSGLADWLAWLNDIQDQPGIVLNKSEKFLRNEFYRENLAYFVGNSGHLDFLQTRMGADKVGVVPLPSGSPLLRVHSFMLSPAATPEEQLLASAFAQFVTEVENQQNLMASVRAVPVNINVNFEGDEAMIELVNQANLATSLPNIPQTKALVQWGEIIYTQVLNTGIDPTKAVETFTTLIDTANGVKTIEEVPVEPCEDEGSLVLWHSWTDIEEKAWTSVINNFAERCPSLQIDTYFVSETDFTQELTKTLEIQAITERANDNTLPQPDLFLASSKHLAFYQDTGLLQTINEWVGPESLSEHLPEAVDDVTNQGLLYGLPQSIVLPALYYNKTLVESGTPAQTFGELLLHAEQGQTVAMNSGFFELFWGAAPFGCESCQTGTLFGATNEIILSESELANWRQWLANADQTGQFIYSADQSELEDLFLAGEVAYLVSGPEFLSSAQEALGGSSVGVASLVHTADEQVSRPFREIGTFYFYHDATIEQTELAIKFAQFATAQDSQTTLLDEGFIIPTHTFIAATVDNPNATSFIYPLYDAISLPDYSQRTLLVESGVFQIFDDLGQ
ncbi:MAG: extracellular solute-binding protein [Chloroflexota bacterium]